jgi:lipopolysaccharide transport system permease protein
MSTIAARKPAAAAHEALIPVHGPIHVIEPWRPGVLARLEEVWRTRYLLPYFGLRFVQRRYKNTWLGWVWLPLRPGLDMLTKALFFGGFLGVSSGTRPYIIFYTFGAAGWILFDSMHKWGIRGIRMSNRFIRKAWCPRLPRITSIIVPALFDLAMSTIVAVIAVFYYLFSRGKLYVYPSHQMLIALGGFMLLALWGLTLAIWFGPMTTHAKDLRLSLNYVTQFWYVVTPIAYPISSLPPKYQPIAELNPLTAPIEMVKYGFLDTHPPTLKEMISTFTTLAVALVAGLWLFDRSERAAVARV